MCRVAALAAILAALAGGRPASGEGSQVLVRHLGDVDPASQGWTRIVTGIPANVTEFAVPWDLGVPAWAVEDASALAAVTNVFEPTLQDRRDAMAAGFSLRAYLRVLRGVAGIDPASGALGLRAGFAHGPLCCSQRSPSAPGTLDGFQEGRSRV